MILLDTHILLGCLRLNDFAIAADIAAGIDEEDTLFASVATLWEIAIKFRAGKLMMAAPPESIPDMAETFDIVILPILSAHALAGAKQNVSTKDPFDRLLLGVCEVENMKLMTLDRALISHPLAWKPK